MQTPTIILSPQKPAVSAAGGHLDVLVRVQAPDLPENQITNHTPKRLSVVVDRSASMSGKPLNEALRCVMHIAKHLTPKDQMSLVVYDDEVDVLVYVYGLRREDDAQLDKALYVWRDAGCPDSKRVRKPKPEVASG